ncbi:MAG: ABC transporter permease [Acidobacteriota bacterium]
MLTRLLARARGLLRRNRIDAEVEDELRFRIEMETQANLARGMAPDDASRTARAAFGGVQQAKEMVREVRALWIESLVQDVRYAGRYLAAHRYFTLGASGMLAVGIGITTAMFTIVDSLVLRPVPFREPVQLAHLWLGGDHGGIVTVSPAVIHAWRDCAAFDAVESAVSNTGLVEAGDVVVTRAVATVTPGVFGMLGGVAALRGRLFDPTDGGPGQTDRVLVSETVWRSLFDADEGLVGRAIRLDGQWVSVIGILPADFRFPSAETALWRPTDLVSVRARPEGWTRTAKAYVRFAPGVPREDALRLALEAARTADSSTAGQRPWVYPLTSPLDSFSRRAVPLLSGGAVLVFIALCANVCVLLLARFTPRRREFSVRTMLGAPRSRLVRQVLTETGVMGVLGTAVGAAIAWALVSMARALLPEPLLLRTLNPLSLDERAVVATGVAGLLATLGAGVLPAWIGTKVRIGESLRVLDCGGTETRRARAFTQTLLIGQLALACTLLVGATLLTRSFVNLATADRGFDTSGITTLWLNVDPASDADAIGRAVRARNLEETFRKMDVVQDVAWSYGVPPGGGFIASGEWRSDRPGASANEMRVTRYAVSPEFFSLYRIGIVSGRAFSSLDSPSDVVVSEELGQALWPDADPLGRTLFFERESLRVVGVAREIHYPSLDSQDDGPELYQPYGGVANTAMVSLRCAPECPDGALIRHRLASAHPEVRVQDVGPVERAYAAKLARPRAAAWLAVAFAVMAALGAAGGLYTVLSYAVSRKHRELAIRAALGASPKQIRRAVLRDSVRVTATGLGVGTLTAIGLARGLVSMLYGLTPFDALSWVLVLGLIGVTALGACWGPARTVTRLDLQSLLREE